MNNPSVMLAIKYLRDRGMSIPVEVLKQVYRKEIKQALSYQPIRNEFWAAVYDAVFNFLSSSQQVGTAVGFMTTALSKAWIETSDIAWKDGGSEPPLDINTQTYVRLDISLQSMYIDSLFERLKYLRKEGDFDPISEAFARANGYADSLDNLYNNVKIAGAGNKMLTFDGDDGKESCGDCQRYKGQRHRASWWKSHNAIPPNRDFECHGYRCQHILVDDNGDAFTI